MLISAPSAEERHRQSHHSPLTSVLVGDISYMITTFPQFKSEKLRTHATQPSGPPQSLDVLAAS